MARQQTLKHHLLHLGGSRVVEEPADERDPKPSAKVAAEHLPDADEDKQKSKEPADVCCDEGRPAHVSRDRPHDGPEHATAVERVAGNQVEQHQGQVDVGQVLCQTQEGFHAGYQRLHRVEKDRQGQAHQRARDRNKKLGDGAGRFRPNLSDAPEEEKRNAAHRNFVPQRHHGVPQFMEQHAHKEHDGRHRAHEPVQQRRPVLELGGIVTTRQHPSEQREDHKPGVIQANRNPQNPA